MGGARVAAIVDCAEAEAVGTFGEDVELVGDGLFLQGDGHAVAVFDGDAVVVGSMPEKGGGTLGVDM